MAKGTQGECAQAGDVDRDSWALESVHRYAERDPVRAVVAAVIRLAVEDTLRGDAEARAWLTGPNCAHWLDFVVPEGIDPVVIRARLLNLAGGPVTAEQLARKQLLARAHRLAGEKRRPATLAANIEPD